MLCSGGVKRSCDVDAESSTIVAVYTETCGILWGEHDSSWCIEVCGKVVNILLGCGSV